MFSLPLITGIAACVINASSVNNIDPELLLSVMTVEGGTPGSVSINKNGSHDLGIMQINTHAWLKLISRSFFNGDEKTAYNKLKDDACFNISVGAWILHHSIILEGGNVWEGVGRYHSATPEYKYRYIGKVKNVYGKITYSQSKQQTNM